MTFLANHRLSRRSLLAGTGAVAAGLVVKPIASGAAEEKKLSFYNWDTYIGETTLSDFNSATGIAVQMDFILDSEDMHSRLREPNHGYDVIVPASDYVPRLIAENLIQPLDPALVPNRRYIQRQFRDATFDPGRRYSVANMWGTMGIGYRKSKVKSTPGSWRWVLDSDAYKGRIALLSEYNSMYAACMRYLGLPMNTTDRKHVEAAERLMIRQKPNVKIFAPDTGQDLLLDGEVDLAIEWNGDMLQTIRRDHDLDYIVPREGSVLWQDALCIPTAAPHPMNAHLFINFLLEPKNGMKLALGIMNATANEAAQKLMPRSYRDNPVIFPSDITLASCLTTEIKSPEVVKMYEESWQRVMAA